MIEKTHIVTEGGYETDSLLPLAIKTFLPPELREGFLLNLYRSLDKAYLDGQIKALEVTRRENQV